MNFMEMAKNTEKGAEDAGEGETTFIKKPEDAIAAMGAAELAKFKTDNEAALAKVRGELNDLYKTGTVKNLEQSSEEIGLRTDIKDLDKKDILAAQRIAELTPPPVAENTDDETAVMTKEDFENAGVEVKITHNDNPFS